MGGQGTEGGGEERGVTGGGYSMNHVPTTMSGVFHFVTAQFQNVDRIFNAIVDYNKSIEKKIVFVQVATESPNYATMFFSFLDTIGNEHRTQRDLSLIRIYLPHAGGSILGSCSKPMEGGTKEKTSCPDDSLLEYNIQR